MSNIQFYLDSSKQQLNISYSSLGKLHGFTLNGELTSDGDTFLAHPESIDNCRDLSQTECMEIKKYVSSESSNPHVVFLESIK